MRKRDTSHDAEDYRRQYAGVTDVEIAALYAIYGFIIHECPGVLQALVHEVRTKH